MNKGRCYLLLLKKEMQSVRSILVILAAVIIGWDIYLYTRLNLWDDALVFGLTFVPVVILAIWPVLMGYLSFRQEWQGNHVHLLLALPVSGWFISSVKLVALLLQTMLLTVVSIAGTLLVSREPLARMIGGLPEGSPIASWFGTMVVMLVIFWIIMLIGAILVQFSYIAGKMFERFSGLISAWVLLLSFWGVTRFASFIVGAFRWMPDIPVKNMNINNNVMYIDTMYIDTAPGIAVLIGALILFGLGSWLLEKHVEI